MNPIGLLGAPSWRDVLPARSHYNTPFEVVQLSAVRKKNPLKHNPNDTWVNLKKTFADMRFPRRFAIDVLESMFELEKPPHSDGLPHCVFFSL